MHGFNGYYQLRVRNTYHNTETSFLIELPRESGFLLQPPESIFQLAAYAEKIFTIVNHDSDDVFSRIRIMRKTGRHSTPQDFFELDSHVLLLKKNRALYQLTKFNQKRIKREAQYAVAVTDAESEEQVAKLPKTPKLEPSEFDLYGSASLAHVPADVLNLVREEEHIRRLQIDALGRYNYLKQRIAEEKGKSKDASGFVEELIDVEDKNAELHILSTNTIMIYYYYEHSTGSWIFLERDRTNGNSTMYATKRDGPNTLPHVQVYSS